MDDDSENDTNGEQSPFIGELDQSDITALEMLSIQMAIADPANKKKQKMKKPLKEKCEKSLKKNSQAV